jgi:hypothetical protein
VIYGDPSAAARSHHRRRALDVIEAAFRTGWITAPDHDLRVAQVETAATVGELNALIRDLAGGAIAEPAAPADLVLPAPIGDDDRFVAPPPPETPSGRGVGGFLWFAVAITGLILAGAAVLVFVTTNAGPDSGSNQGFTSEGSAVVSPSDPLPSEEAPTSPAHYALTRPGIAVFKHDFADEFGAHTPVTAVSLFEDFVTVAIPDVSFGKYQTWVYRRGDFSKAGRSTDDRGSATFDVQDIDEAALAATLRSAPRRVDVRRPSERTVVITLRADGRPEILIGLANQRGDAGYITTTLAGKVLEVRRATG